MKKYTRSFLFISFLALMFIFTPALVQAGPGDPGCDPLDPSCPIDGGLGFLLAAGIGYGIQKIKNSHKKEASAL